MSDFFWLLLPLAAASGWLAAIKSFKKDKAKNNLETNPVYFRGLNHLLNEEPDKAIDVFVEMLEVDSDTVETHLALGNLFRKRGEVERAIRLHQNLIARPALSKEHRGQALLELGKDYMRAGLYDRAENLFKELKQIEMHVEHALKNLLTIYQQEKDWNACLKTAESLEGFTGESQMLSRSHYYCELALIEKNIGQMHNAQKHLEKALSVDQNCVRANHLMAQYTISIGDRNEAIRLLKLAVNQDPEYLPEVFSELLDTCETPDDYENLYEFLMNIAIQNKNSGAELYLSELIRKKDGDSAAFDFLLQSVSKTPSMQGLVRLVELQKYNSNLRDKDLLQNVHIHLKKLLRDNVDYQCAQCGFKAKTVHWQCPSCRTWSSLKRKPLIENENISKSRDYS